MSPPLPARDDIQFNECFLHTRARAELEAVTNFFAEGIEGVGGTQAASVALRVFAVRHITPVAAGFNCDFEPHVKVTLPLGINAVNDPNSDRADHAVTAAAGIGRD